MKVAKRLSGGFLGIIAFKANVYCDVLAASRFLQWITKEVVWLNDSENHSSDYQVPLSVVASKRCAFNSLGR